MDVHLSALSQNWLMLIKSSESEKAEQPLEPVTASLNQISEGGVSALIRIRLTRTFTLVFSPPPSSSHHRPG